jgi:phosphoglycolate phosphatase-like HAD superfamily hydrolase
LNTSAPNTSFDVIFFDFDGTLVDSAAVKRNCFYSLFPTAPEYGSIVSQVLLDNPEGSRFYVIPRMIEEMFTKGLVLPPGTTANTAIESYTDQVLAAVMKCDEMPGAGRVLGSLAGRCAICIASNTPESDLRKLVEARKWDGLVRSIDGYPRRKIDIVSERLSEFGVSASRALVVGDGRGDEEAAAANGCAFHRIAGPGDLMKVTTILGIDNVC